MATFYNFATKRETNPLENVTHIHVNRNSIVSNLLEIILTKLSQRSGNKPAFKVIQEKYQIVYRAEIIDDTLCIKWFDTNRGKIINLIPRTSVHFRIDDNVLHLW